MQTKLKYNILNEAGFMMGKIVTELVVTGSERRGRLNSIQPSNCEWVTLMQTINAAGWTIPPFLIFTGKYHLSAWYEEESIPQDWEIAVSENGLTTNKLGVEWLKHFIKHTEGKMIRACRLLICNSYESHHSLGFQELCRENNIFTLYMPPYSSHLL
jgi:hypothetical protein